MSTQFLGIPPHPLSAEYAILKASSHYNRCMYKHYKHLYEKYRKKWQFKRAAFAWFKMVWYESKMYDAQIAELLTELNKTSHVRITI